VTGVLENGAAAVKDGLATAGVAGWGCEGVVSPTAFVAV